VLQRDILYGPFVEATQSTHDGALGLASPRIAATQHTATHCSTLQHAEHGAVDLARPHIAATQHTATHCDTLQHAAPRRACNSRARIPAHRCNTLQHAATQCHASTTAIPRHRPHDMGNDTHGGQGYELYSDYAHSHTHNTVKHTHEHTCTHTHAHTRTHKHTRQHTHTCVLGGVLLSTSGFTAKCARDGSAMTPAARPPRAPRTGKCSEKSAL